MKVEGCYADCTNECSGALTKEHIISKSLIGKEMTVKINNKEEKFTKKSFVVNNLCEYHNNRFGNIEAHMRYFMDFLVKDASLYKPINTSQSLSEFNLPNKVSIKGKYLENWLLKSAINYAYLQNEFDRPNFNFKYISKRLFANATFDYPFGLSLIFPDEQKTHQHAGEVFFEPYKDGNELCGVTINLQGFLFLIWLPTTNSHKITKDGIPVDGKVYKLGKSIEWHSKGYKLNMFAGDGSIVTRSVLKIKW
jgi:hypothetical protein